MSPMRTYTKTCVVCTPNSKFIVNYYCTKTVLKFFSKLKNFHFCAPDHSFDRAPLEPPIAISPTASSLIKFLSLENFLSKFYRSSETTCTNHDSKNFKPM